MDKQDVAARDLFFLYVFAHPHECFSRISRIKRDPVLFQHRFYGLHDSSVIFSVARCIVIKENRILLELFFGSTAAEIRTNAGYHNISPSRVFPGDADADDSSIISIQNLPANQSCMGCPGTGGKENIIEVNALRFLEFLYFLIALNIGFCSDVSVPQSCHELH